MSEAPPVTPELLEAVVRPLLTLDGAHDWAHVRRVFRLGLRLAADLRATGGGGGDELALRIALVCHDMGPKVGAGGNAWVMASELRDVLDAVPGLHCPESSLGVALQAINDHSWQRGHRPATLVGALVQDADRLDAIGAIGIARCFAWGGSHGVPIHDPAGGKSSLGHFDEKLLDIHGRLNLEVSQTLALRRHQFLEEFRLQFLREWAGHA